MNRQTFLAYLEEPSKLYQMSLVELQGLVLEYPYSANLRLLLLLKARLEDHPRQNEMLAQLSSRTFDREYLYDFMRELDREEQQKIALEERLELPELDKLEFALADPEPEPLAIDATLSIGADAPSTTSFATSLDKNDTEFDEPDFPSEAASLSVPSTKAIEIELEVEPQPKPVVLNMAKLIGSAAAISEVCAGLQQPPVPDVVAEPVAEAEEEVALPKKVDDELKQRLRRHRKKQLKRLKNQQRDRIKEIVRKSVSPQQETASETLAKLLAHQGQYAQAIKMYQQLSLLNPEKSAKFAARIKDLKEKL